MPDNILFIDLETTSLFLSECKIVQIGMIFNNKTSSILINPECPIPIEATNVHHITDEMVKDSPTFKTISDRFLRLWNQSEYICGYNLRNYDYNVLYIEFLRCGIELPRKPIIDVYEMVKGFENNRKLSSVYLRYFGEKLEGNHDALNDIKAARSIFIYIKNKLK